MIHSQRSGFTLPELLVALAIGGILAALAGVGVQHASARAQGTRCLSHLRTLGGATMTYAADNDMRLPATVHQRRQGLTSWSLALQPYAGESPLSFKCPADRIDRPYSYVINDFLTPNPAGAEDLDLSRLSRIARPGATVLFAESADGFFGDHFHFASHRGTYIPPAVVKTQIAVERHAGSANYLFVDGHVESLPWKSVQATLAQEPSSFIDPTAGETSPATQPIIKP